MQGFNMIREGHRIWKMHLGLLQSSVSGHLTYKAMYLSAHHSDNALSCMDSETLRNCKRNSKTVHLAVSLWLIQYSSWNNHFACLVIIHPTEGWYPDTHRPNSEMAGKLGQSSTAIQHPYKKPEEIYDSINYQFYNSGISIWNLQFFKIAIMKTAN